MRNDPRLDTAIHEAGHVVVAYYSGVKIHYSTIQQDGRLSGRTTYTYKIFRRRVVDRISVAGYIACMVYDTKYSNQSEERTQNHLKTSEDDWVLVRGNIDKAFRIAHEILEEHWHQVEAVAIALLDSPTGTLSESQLSEILSTKNMKKGTQNENY